jgi:hypothetical protein
MQNTVYRSWPAEIPISGQDGERKKPTFKPFATLQFSESFEMWDSRNADFLIELALKGDIQFL